MHRHMFSTRGRSFPSLVPVSRLFSSSSLDGVVVRSRVFVPSDLASPCLKFTSLPHFLMAKFNSLEGKTAIIDPFALKQVSYGQLADSTYAFAHALRARFNMKKGECLAIIAPNDMNYFTAFIGVGLTGGHSTCMNPAYTAGEIKTQLEMTNTKVVVAHPLCVEKTIMATRDMAGVHIIVMDTHAPVTPKANTNTHSMTAMIKESKVAVDVSAFSVPPDFDAANSVFTIPFSSGTTGKSKGVVLTHYNIMANILQLLPFEGQGEGELKMLVPLPFFHIYGMVVGMCFPLYMSGQLILMPAFDLQSFLQAVQDYKVTRSLIVPPIVLALAKHPMVDEYDLSSLQSVVCGAAPLSKDLQESCAARLKVKIKQGWGMTELSPLGSTYTDGPPYSPSGSSGQLAPCTEGKIVCVETGRDLPFDSDGEICVRGPQVMLGYLNNQAATDLIIKDGWLHSGDIGHFDHEGNLFITDRLKELIKFKGFQVAPAELEGIINSIPDVIDCIVIPVQDEEAGELPRAYVVPRKNSMGDAVISEQEVLDFVARVVAPHKKLRGGVVFVDSVPKSASGKLLRRVQVEMDRLQYPPRS